MNKEVGPGSHSLPHFSPSLISLAVSVDVKHHERRRRNGSEVKSCVKVEVAALGSPSLISLMVSLDVKHQ